MILNRHKRHQALLRIIACTIIATGEIKDPEVLGMMIDNLSDLAYCVGGVKGMREFTYTVIKEAQNGTD